MSASFYGHDGERYLGVAFDRIAVTVSEHVTIERIAEEVRRALATDEEFRILVREGVREAMAKLNIREVVELAVKDAIDVLHRDVLENRK